MEKRATLFSCPTGVQIQVTREQSLTQGRVRVLVRSGQKPEGPAATGRRCRFRFALPCLLLFAASLLGSGRAADRYMIQNWTIEKGLPSDSATAIAQTRDGFIWIGCEEGLARFDGLRMEVFNRENTPALQNHYIRSLCPDGENGLWIGTFAGELLHYHEGRFDKLWQSTRTGGKAILFIARDLHGSIWASVSDHGLVPVSAGPEKAAALPGEIFATLFESKTLTWTASDSGLTCHEPGKTRSYVPESWQPGDHFTALCADGAGGLWCGTSAGNLYRFQNGRFIAFAFPPSWTRKTINSLLRDSRGTIWIGSGGNGVWQLSATGKELAPAPILPGMIVNRLLEDSEGAIWCATSGAGVHMIREKQIRSLAAAAGLLNEIILPVLEDSQGRIWAGTAGGGLYAMENGRFVRFGPERGFPGEIIFSLAEDGDGRLWASAAGGHLYMLAGGRFRKVAVEGAATPPKLFRSLFTDSEGFVWVGTSGEGLWRGRQGKIRAVNSPEDLRKARVLCFASDGDGTLWIGTDGSGLFGRRPRTGNYIHYSVANGLPANSIDTLLPDAESSGLWIGTAGGGLAHLSPRGIAVLDLKDGLFDPVILQMLDDGRGSYWFTSNRGISRVLKQDLKRALAGAGPVTSIVYGTDDGLPSAECNGGVFPAGIRARDGRFLIPTMKGLAVLDPLRLADKPSPYPVAIEKIIADQRVVGAATTSLGPGVSRLEFHFTRPTFQGADKVRFRYRLDGFDREWQDAKALRVATYTNLPPRRFVFRVEATDRHRRWNGPAASFSFTIMPRFTQTWLFYCLCLAFGFGLLTFGYRAMLMKQNEKVLVRQVAERTRDLRQILADKEKLILELQHRVGNTLQIVMALTDPLPESTERRILRQRILVLADVQIVVQSAPDFHSLPMQPLLTRIAASMTTWKPGQAPIAVQPTAAVFPIETATPLALIVHEWACVAQDCFFQEPHPAASHSAGKIPAPGLVIALQPSGAGWRLAIEVSGGVVPTVLPSTGGLAPELLLSGILCQQLGGSITAKGEQGLWEMEFPGPAKGSAG